MKISSVKYLFGQGIKSVWTNRVMSFASFCILMVSLLLVGFSMLFTANINRFIGGIEDKNEVIVFLTDGTTDEYITSMETELNTMDNVSNVEFYSKEQAFSEYKGKMENADAIFESLGEESPFPDAFRIKVKDVSLMSATKNEISTMENIDSVSAPDEFAELLTSIKSTVTLISTAIVIALVIVCMVIISNATRTSVFSRRKEINIMKYVGATNAFIRIPFFIEGMMTGILAAGVASVLTWFGYDSLIDALKTQMSLWKAFGMDEFIPFDAVVTKVVLGYVISGAFLGAMGSVFSTRKHLKV